MNDRNVLEFAFTSFDTFVTVSIERIAGLPFRYFSTDKYFRCRYSGNTLLVKDGSLKVPNGQRGSSCGNGAPG